MRGWWDHGVPGRPPSPPPPAHSPSPLSLSPADVKFISNPPSMVAAGSVLAAVQGLPLGSSNSFLSYPRLTRFLSKVIKCDAVSDQLRRSYAGLAGLLSNRVLETSSTRGSKASSLMGEGGGCPVFRRKGPGHTEPWPQADRVPASPHPPGAPLEGEASRSTCWQARRVLRFPRSRQEPQTPPGEPSRERGHKAGPSMIRALMACGAVAPSSFVCATMRTAHKWRL